MSSAKYPTYQFVSSKHLPTTSKFYYSFVDPVRIPTYVREALKDVNCVKAMDKEMKTTKKDETWDIVERLEEMKSVSCM